MNGAGLILLLEFTACGNYMVVKEGKEVKSND